MVVEVKKVMAMLPIPIMLDDDMSMELVEVAMNLPDMVGVGVSDMDVDMVFMSMTANMSW